MFLPRSALAPCPPGNIRNGQACMHTPLPRAAGNREWVPESLLFVFPRREEARIRQDRPLLSLLAFAIRQAIREQLLTLRRRRGGQRSGRLIGVPWCRHACAIGELFRPALEHRWVRETRSSR
jgi:hypothetical protein